MDPPTAAEAEEGASLEIRSNAAFLDEHKRLLESSGGAQYKSNFRATAQRVYEVLKAIPEDRNNKEQWAKAQALWKESSDIDPAMPSWDNIRKPTIYKIDEKVDAKFRVKGQEVIVIEDIQPRFKKEMLANGNPKDIDEFKQLAKEFGDKYHVKKGVLDLLLVSKSATAPARQQQQLALAPGQQARAPQVPRGRSRRSSNAVPMSRAAPPYTVTLPPAAPQAAAAAFGAQTATAILSQLRPDQPFVMNFVQTQNNTSFAEGATNNNFSEGTFAAGASASFGGTQHHNTNGNDGDTAATKEDVAMLSSKLDAVGTKVDQGTETITQKVQDATVEIQESAVKTARARPSPVARGGTNLDGTFAASSSAKSPSHEEHRTWKSTDFMDFQTLRKRMKDRMQNLEEDLEEGDEIPELWIKLPDLDQKCTSLRSLLELVNQNTVRTSPSCAFFLYASEIDAFQPPENWSELYSSILPAHFGESYDVWAEVLWTTTKDVTEVTEINFQVFATSPAEARGTLGELTEILARSGDVLRIHIEGAAEHGEPQAPLPPLSAKRIHDILEGAHPNLTELKLQKFTLTAVQHRAFQIFKNPAFQDKHPGFQVVYAKCKVLDVDDSPETKEEELSEDGGATEDDGLPVDTSSTAWNSPNATTAGNVYDGVSPDWGGTAFSNASFSNQWKCSTCTTMNSMDQDKCAACEKDENGDSKPAAVQNLSVPVANQSDITTGLRASVQSSGSAVSPAVADAAHLEQTGLSATQGENSMAGGLGGSAAGIGERGFYFPTNAGNLTVQGTEAAGSGANVQTPGFTFTGTDTSPALTDASLLVGVDSVPEARQLDSVQQPEQIGPPTAQGDNGGVSCMFGGSPAARSGDNDVNEEDAILDEPAVVEEIENQAPAVEPEARVVAAADLQKPEEDEQPVPKAVAPLRRRSTRSCRKPDRLKMS